MKVLDIMVKEVATLDVNDELSLANDIMRLGRIRHLPVVEGNKLVGIWVGVLPVAVVPLWQLKQLAVIAA